MYHAIVQGHLKVSSKEHKFCETIYSKLYFTCIALLLNILSKSVTSAAPPPAGTRPLNQQHTRSSVWHLSLTELLSFENIASYIQD